MKTEESTTRHISIDKIRIDGGTQPRSSLDQSVVDEYSAAIQMGVKFPPATVFYDGSDYWLADGFHRRAGHAAAGRTKMECEVQQGTQRDAVLYSVGANATHGLPRSNADKRRAVMVLLNDKEWVKWSDREISRRCAVSDRFVNSLRAELPSANSSQIERKAERNGKTFTINTANIGSRPKSSPDHSPRRIDTSTEQQSFEDETAAAVEDETIEPEPATSIAEDEEIDEETGKPYPPVPPGDPRDEAINDPERLATNLIIKIRGSMRGSGSLNLAKAMRGRH